MDGKKKIIFNLSCPTFCNFFYHFKFCRNKKNGKVMILINNLKKIKYYILYEVTDFMTNNFSFKYYVFTSLIRSWKSRTTFHWNLTLFIMLHSRLIVRLSMIQLNIVLQKVNEDGNNYQHFNFWITNFISLLTLLSLYIVKYDVISNTFTRNILIFHFYKL